VTIISRSVEISIARDGGEMVRAHLFVDSFFFYLFFFYLSFYFCLRNKVVSAPDM